MKDLKKNIIFLAAGIVLGCIVGGLTIKSVYDKPVADVRIERDTVTVHDTLVRYMPKPVSVEAVRTEYRLLPVYHTDTVTKTDYIAFHDTAFVEVPISSKHYRSPEYDAWVSGYEPSLDSIKVYNKERVVTETVTVTKKARAKRWGIGFTGGYGYDFNSKTAAPYVGVGVSYNIITF